MFLGRAPAIPPLRFARRADVTTKSPTVQSILTSLWAADRVRVYSSTPGTDDLVFDAAVSTFRDFVVAAAPDGAFFGYDIEDGVDWETGIGQYHASTNSMTRYLVASSSTGGGKVDFRGDAKFVSVTLLASQVSGAIWQATGGVVTEVGGFRIHTFLNDGSFQVLSGARSVKILVVAGGGAGGGVNGTGVSCGGGGGGRVIETTLTLSPGNYPITIGKGGIGAVASPGQDGADTAFNYPQLIADGGGGGGGTNANRAGDAGGSGGGGGNPNASVNGGAAAPSAFSSVAGQGNNGGDCTGNTSAQSGGGGGGGGGPGAAGGTSASPGNGGVGYSSSISGSATQYGGGGGGGCGTNASTAVGAGGAGGGGAGKSTGNGGAASPGTGGGGGGGGGAANSAGGNGGSGIVIVAYAI